MPDTVNNAAAIAGAIGGLKAEVKALGKTTAEGFDGINDRLDLQNGRLRAVENTTAKLGVSTVTTGACEIIRGACSKARAAGARAFLIPSAVGIVVAVVAVLLGKLLG